MQTLYFDCFAGAGGDMIVAALIDAGVPLEKISAGLARLSLPGFQVRTERVSRRGLVGTRFIVDTATADHTERHLADILGLLRSADLPPRALSRAVAAFEKLAAAEAQVHGIPLEHVHFHEVGAVDSIVDITAAMLAVEELNPQQIVCSPLPTGCGTVECAHGVLPVPAPATSLLLRGVPLAECDEQGELLTPTAAAVLTTLAERFGPAPAMVPIRIGWGAGTRDDARRPNLLRVICGESSASGEADEVVVLEANLDDATPQMIGHSISRLLEAGALDAYSVPIYMKKNRPGVVLTAICAPADVTALEAIVFAETTTFGVRRHTASRSKLSRRHEVVTTPYGPIRVKVGLRQGGTVTAAPEYDDCAAAASRAGVALREVIEAASRCWRQAEAVPGPS